MDLTLKNSPMKLFKEEQESALRSVLMMLLSPSQFIFSEASSKFLEAALPLGNECMGMLVTRIKYSQKSYDILLLCQNHDQPHDAIVKPVKTLILNIMWILAE
jgi:hypothetical protein